MNWHERYKAMKKGLGLTNSDIAEITGNSADSEKPSRAKQINYKTANPKKVKQINHENI